MNALLWLSLSGLLAQGVDLDRQRNLGKAYYERGEYTLAVEQLARVVDSDDARARDYFNAGMAYLQNAEQDRALAALMTARQMDSNLVEVDFGLGVLYKRQLRYPLAREAFLKVVARDPNDPSTWFNIGAVTASMQLTEEAEKAFDNVRAMGYARAQNYYVSALFRLANILARRGASAEARELFAEVQGLRDKTPNVSLTPTALENGYYGRIEFPSARNIVVSPTIDVALERAGELRYAESGCEREPSVALHDFDVDGDVDIFVVSPCGGGGLFRNDGEGELDDVTAEVGIAFPHNGSGAAFVDLDNSGFASLYVWGESQSYLYRNRGGRFEEVTSAPGLTAGASAAVFLDADNDGRIDLFASHSDDGLVLHRNLDDGVFAEVWSDDSTRARGVAAVDLDDDGFMDVVVVPTSGDGIVLSNQGGVFAQSRTFLDLAGTSPAHLHIIDLDHDGWLDVLALDDEGATALGNRRGQLELLPALQGWASLIPIDLDGDGTASFFGRDARGRHSLVSYQGEGRFGARPISISDDRVVTAADLSGDGGTQLLAAPRDGTIRFYRRTQPASPAWIRIALEGTKTNRQALGAVVEIKAGSFYQKHLYSGRPLTLFVGERETLDVVRVTWANGVIQNEVDVATRQLLAIEEAEQQTSSCPFIYVWDGETFRFLTDAVGRAPLGEILPDGNVVIPNPEDYIRIPPDAMVARDGRFVFQLTEELRELAAIDAVELLAIDHPTHLQIYANERFSAPPFEPFRLYIVGETWSPELATDRRGKDVLRDVMHADGRYVTSFSRHRVPGFAEEHALVLTAPERTNGEPLWLFLSGWVYWPSSSSMKALDSHDSMTPRPPALQVRDTAGEWVTVIEDLGLPSGIGRTLVADLAGRFLSDDRQVRIVSNFAVYWDRAFFGEPNTSAKILTRVVERGPADLHFRGFSTVSLTNRESPERYDYSTLQSEPPWNAVSGRYTRYGDVASLLARADSGMVVMAPGDEVSLSFNARSLPPVASGWSRTFFLHLTGWAKDQDPNTISSTTVAPLPGGEDPAMDRFQTREVPSLVAPLGPPAALAERARR